MLSPRALKYIRPYHTIFLATLTCFELRYCQSIVIIDPLKTCPTRSSAVANIDNLTNKSANTTTDKTTDATTNMIADKTVDTISDAITDIIANVANCMIADMTETATENSGNQATTKQPARGSTNSNMNGIPTKNTEQEKATK